MLNLRFLCLLAVLLVLTSCGRNAPHLPKADAILIEPSHRKINSPLETGAILDFIQNLPSGWQKPLSALPSPAGTLLLTDSEKPVATVFFGATWIALRLPNSNADLLHPWTADDRDKLDHLLEAARP